MNEFVENAVVDTDLAIVEADELVPEESIESKETPDELTLLRAEIATLREDIRLRDEREKASSRMIDEIKEFEKYFPEVGLHQIPNDVWEQVREGASLSASFALNLKKLEMERKRASDFNEKNRRMSSGSLMQNESEKYFSPSEVKKMTPAQVKSHYDDILESMRHWN